jgi:hypothetical protein
MERAFGVRFKAPVVGSKFKSAENVRGAVARLHRHVRRLRRSSLPCRR